MKIRNSKRRGEWAGKYWKLDEFLWWWSEPLPWQKGLKDLKSLHSLFLWVSLGFVSKRRNLRVANLRHHLRQWKTRCGDDFSFRSNAQKLLFVCPSSIKALAVSRREFCHRSCRRCWTAIPKLIFFRFACTFVAHPPHPLLKGFRDARKLLAPCNQSSQLPQQWVR